MVILFLMIIIMYLFFDYSASTKNYRPTKMIWTISLVMHYQPITEHNFLKLFVRFLPIPVGNCCLVFSVCLSRFGSSNSLRPIRYTALTDGKQSSQKTTESERSRIAKFRRNLQDSDQKTCPNPQEILGIVPKTD